ncbi:uncharacterized protein LOC144098190 [Amblyomma americanum]
MASYTHTGESSTAAAATASEQEVPHEKDIIQTSLQPSNESVQHLCDAGSAAEIAGPSQSDSEGTTTAPPLAEQQSVSPEEVAAEQLKEQEVEVLMEWETDSSGTISAEEEMPIPVSPPMRKKPCHRQLPFDRNQSDREAAVAGLRQGTGNAQATARPSLQARRVAVMPSGKKETPEKAFLRHQPMKVFLAAQVFSTSVADAIAECRELNVTSLRDSAATEEFVRYVNNVFDILNS